MTVAEGDPSFLLSAVTRGIWSQFTLISMSRVKSRLSYLLRCVCVCWRHAYFSLHPRLTPRAFPPVPRIASDPTEEFHRGPVNKLISVARGRLASAGRDATVRLWDVSSDEVATGKEQCGPRRVGLLRRPAHRCHGLRFV